VAQEAHRATGKSENGVAHLTKTPEGVKLVYFESGSFHVFFKGGVTGL
jgi:hypothetical protein